MSLTGDEANNHGRSKTMYTFEGHDYKKDFELEVQQPMLDFIDIGPRRERLQNQNYNIDSYYRAALV